MVISKEESVDTRLKVIYLLLTIVLIPAFCVFYYRYVPLVKPFQMILVPLLIILFIATLLNREWGMLFFIFAIPLANNIPYYFGIYGNIPHAPTALVLFLVFFLGLLINSILSNSKLDISHPIYRPLGLFGLIIIVSGIITFCRYTNYFPFLANRIYELIINVNEVRVGGAIMSDIFNSLNYLTSFLLFAILFSYIKSIVFLKKMLVTLSLSVFLSLLFAYIQKYIFSGIGNMPYWTGLNQINSTFKDPNSFGVFLSAYIPLLLGMIYYFKKSIRILLLIQLPIAFFIFPSIGSRSPLLGIIFSTAVFIVLSSFNKREFKKKLLLATSIILIVAISILLVFLYAKNASLNERIGQTVDKLFNKDSASTVFTGKTNLWKIAAKMIKDYPLTGVGIGAFIIELPNYAKIMGVDHGYTDSAENYFYQVSSELGIIGLLLILWMFFEIVKQMRAGWIACQIDERDKMVLIGAISGLAAIFISYLFHSYIGSFEVKYIFWFLVAVIFVLGRAKYKIIKPKKYERRIRIAGFGLLFAFSGIHLWNSTHGLSIKNRTEMLSWNQNFGLYEPETDNRGFNFRWLKKSAGITVEKLGNILVLPMIASHPDIDKNQVKVKIYQADHSFQNNRLLSEIQFKEKTWKYCEIPLPNQNTKMISLVIETNRTWSPLKYLKIPDQRSLAIGLGEIYYRYPSEISTDKIRLAKTISHKNWLGGSKEYLLVNSTGHMKLGVDERNPVLRLWLLGQKAYDVGPYVIVRLDNTIIGKTMLNEGDWTSLVFARDIKEGEHVLSVEFTNDFYDARKGLDRNVILGEVELIYLKMN